MFPDGSDTTTTTKTEQYRSKISWLNVISHWHKQKSALEKKVSKALYVKIISIERLESLAQKHSISSSHQVGNVHPVWYVNVPSVIQLIILGCIIMATNPCVCSQCYTC